MTVRDTITVTDSLYSRYIVLEWEREAEQSTLLPADSLWTGTVVLQNPVISQREGMQEQSFLDSALIMIFTLLTIYFFREILVTLPSIIKSLVSYKEHVRIEEKLSAAKQRDVTALMAAIYFPVFLTITLGDNIAGYSGIQEWIQFLAATGFVLVYWIFKSFILSFLGWVTKNKQTFGLVGKIGYNHLIMAAIFSTPILLSRFFIPDIEFSLFSKLLTYCILAIYALYLIRVYQAIISNRFSHIFYILYLCSVEFLPIALFINFLLSYQ